MRYVGVPRNSVGDPHEISGSASSGDGSREKGPSSLAEKRKPVRFRRAILALFFFLCPAQAEQVRLFILHTNDIHGHLEPVTAGSDTTAGFARTATVIRSIQAAFPGQVLLLDGGDMALGTPTSGLFFGIPTAESLKSLHYDVTTLGNHEFNWGKEKMFAYISATGAATVCANLVTEDGHPVIPPSHVIERNGAKIGIIGLVAPDTASRSPKAYTQGWRFLDPATATQKALQNLPEVDAIIALTHIGVPADQKLAREVPQLDLIVGGHSHTALHEPLIENGVPIVQTGCYARFLGVLQVEIDTEADKLKLLSHHLVPIDESIAPDPEVSAIVRGYADKVQPILDKVIGEVQSDILNKPTPGSLDTPLGNYIAEALKTQAQTDVAFYNRGGVRGHLTKGPLTVRTLHEMFPFDDPVTVLEASGQELIDVIEQGTQTRAKLSPSQEITYLNGKALLNGRPIQPRKRYTLAVTGFLSTGGDGMSILNGLKVVRTLPFTRDVMQAHIVQHPRPASPKAGRIQGKETKDE